MSPKSKATQSEEAITEAGIRVFLANPGAGMSEIAKTAGVGRATLYRHYSSQEELVRHVAEVCLDQMNGAVAHLGRHKGLEALGASIESIMPLADRFMLLSSFWSFFELDQDISYRIGQLFNGLNDLVEQGKLAGEIDTELPTIWVVAFFENTLTTAWWLVEAGDFNASDGAAYARRSFERACSP